MKKYEDYRVQMTKQSISTAFIQLLKLKVIQKITVKELCLKAHMNRGTFYLHYHDVYDLLDQIQMELIQEFQNILSNPDTQGQENLELMIIEIFKYFQRNRDFCLVMFGPYGDLQFIEKLVKLGQKKLKEKHSEEYDQEALDYRYIYISLGVLGILKQWLFDVPQKKVEDMALIVIKIINI